MEKSVVSDALDKQKVVVEMIRLLVDEFNCNHQADISQEVGSSAQQTIFSREGEQRQISQFLVDNMNSRRSGLMYLCGHPGTGKTSSLNLVLSKIRKNNNSLLSNNHQLYMYNAMTYSDVKSFALTLHQDLTQGLTGQEVKKLGRSQVDDEDISQLIAKTLAKSSNSQRDEFGNRSKDVHKIIVIDEVDQFVSNEKAFTLLVKAILRGSKSANTNTSIVGIANSVDLPFKKKHSAIAMRDCQLLFTPYSIDQLTDILEQKINSKVPQLPMKMKTKQIISMFVNLVDDLAFEFIAKKVAKLNGDIRVAFDMMKAALSTLADSVSTAKIMPPDNEIRVTYQLLLKIYE